MADAVDQAFRRRPHKVEAAEGFVRLEVLRGGADHRDFWLLTWWVDQEAFDRWHHSPEHKASHGLIPRGLKLVKHSIELHRLEHICS